LPDVNFVYSFGCSFNYSVYNSDLRYNDSRSCPVKRRSKHLSTKTNKAATTTDEVMTVLEDQRKIGMPFLHACLAMVLSAFFLS
jgi:hypothetical protein